jgi:hypothetical protein
LWWEGPLDLGSGGAYWVLQRSTNPTSGWTTVYSSPWNPESEWGVFTDFGLDDGTTYYYRVVPRNSAGWGTPSAVRSATPPGPRVPAGAVCALGAAHYNQYVLWRLTGAGAGTGVSYGSSRECHGPAGETYTIFASEVAARRHCAATYPDYPYGYVLAPWQWRPALPNNWWTCISG